MHERALLVCVMLLGGCGGDSMCSSTHELVVLDSSNGTRICDATVTTTPGDDGGAQTWTPTGGSADCRYSLTTTTRGLSATLTVSHANYRSLMVPGVALGCETHDTQPIQTMLTPM